MSKRRKLLRSMKEFGLSWSESSKKWLVDPVQKAKNMLNRITSR
jgi:hypothetical protein